MLLISTHGKTMLQTWELQLDECRSTWAPMSDNAPLIKHTMEAAVVWMFLANKSTVHFLSAYIQWLQLSVSAHFCSEHGFQPTKQVRVHIIHYPSLFDQTLQ